MNLGRPTTLLAARQADLRPLPGRVGLAAGDPHPESGWRHADAFQAWQAVAKRRAGPLFRPISSGGRIDGAALHPDAVRRILAGRSRMAGIEIEEAERLSPHALRVGFITEAYGKGVRDEDIMRHTRHRDLRTMRGYVQRAGLLSESPAGLLDL